MKMKKFLASVLSVLMLASSMSYAAFAQDTTEDEAPTTVTITFDRQNGAYKKETVNGVKNTWVNYAVSTADVEVGATVTFPEDPTYIYHEFLGWSAEKNGEIIEDLSAVTATEATTYYGVWQWSKADSTPLEHMYAVDENTKMVNENCTNNGVFYDATTNSVYKQFAVKTSGKSGSCNMYNGLSYSIPGTELHMVALVRTNMTGYKASAGVYTSSNKSGTSYNSLEMTSSEIIPDSAKDEWVTVYLSKTDMENFGIGTHIDFDVTGSHPATNVGTEYFDVAGMALFATEAEAEAFDIEEATAYNGTAAVYFDAQLTENDDTDVYDEYPTNLENDGFALVGWTLDPTAETIEYVDLTKLPIPTEDVTYYAVWNEERTINFYKNDGTEEVETLVLGKGASLTAPEFQIEGKKFLGWAEAPDGAIVEVQATAEESKNYYAIWLNNWLTQVVVNDNDYDAATKSGKWYGIEDLETAVRLDFVMPYGYPTSIVPTIVPTAANGEAVYNAPETFDGDGFIVMGDITIPVTFTVAEKDSVIDMKTVPTETVNADGRGAFAIKDNTDKGISALKVIPIYSTESEYYEEGKYIPTNGTGIEGWDTFPTHNIESYSQYRALVYYDDGGDGIDAPDKAFIGISGVHTRGTFKSQKLWAANEYKTNRWEYIYFNVPDDKYGMTHQLSYHFLFGKNANAFKNDVVYVAEVCALVDGDEKYLQYVPMGLSSTNETSAKNDGTITGVTADMEIAIGDGEYKAVTEYTYDAETGVVSGLAPATYSVRYAGDDKFAASEAVELVVTPDSVEIYFEDGDEATEAVIQTYAYNDAIVLPTTPSKAGYAFKGWALGDAEEAYDFTDAVATAELDGAVFNALWERINVIYVDGTAEDSGDGFTVNTPINSIADAWNLLAGIDGKIIVVGETQLAGNITGHGGNITITAEGDGFITWNGAVFNKGEGGSIKFENITLKYFGDNPWSFMEFHGLNYEFGEGFDNPEGEIDGVTYHTLKVRSGGENGFHYTGEDGKTYIDLPEKVVVRGGNFDSLYLGGKGPHINEDIYVEFYGGTGNLTTGNDSVKNQTVQTYGGKLQNTKVLLEAAPTAVGINWINEILGAYEFIANNGVTTVPSFKNAANEVLTPAGGTWIIHSAEGGRVDFTETIGTYKFTTDKTYVVITDAQNVSTKYRMADGVTGDANLYGEEAALELALAQGDYTVTYTDEGVSVKGEFGTPNKTQSFELNAANNYTVTVSDAMIAAAEDEVETNNMLAGYKFSGEFVSNDGKYKTVDGVLTVTEYTDETIYLYPEYVEDDTLPYYHIAGLYNDKSQTLDVTVSIANGKFTAGTVGGAFDKDILEFTGYTVGAKVSNDIGDAPQIVKDAMYDGEDNKFVFVWNAKDGSVDATAADVEIITFHFNVKDAEGRDAESLMVDGAVSFYHPENEYDEYFDGNHYLVSPVLDEDDDQFAVNYVPVYEGNISIESAPTDPATITVKVTMPDKEGATEDDIAYLAYEKVGESDWKFIALEEAGNEEATIEKVISDVFYVGEKYEFTIVKNGYTGSEVKVITLEDGMTLESTIIGGDIKESFTGEDENAVDIVDFGDGSVTLADFVRVVRAFDEASTDEYNAVVDINEDGEVTVADLGIVKANFGESFDDVELIVTAPADGE